MESLYIIDYDELNKRLKEIIGEDLEIDEKNAKDKIKKLYYDRMMRKEKLNYIIDNTSKYQNENSKILNFENDIKIFYNATEILLNLFNSENEIISIENYELVYELIVNTAIKEILKEDIPNLMKISEYIQEKDISNIVDCINNLFTTIDFDKINQTQFFTIINDEIEDFLNK